MPDESTYQTIQWRLIPFLMLCYVVSYLDRVNIGFAKLQMLRDLHFSETTYGIGAGIFFVGYVLCGVPSNLALHRLGAKVWIALLMLTWGVLSGLMAFVKTPSEFFVLRLLLGAAEAGFLPGVVVYLTYWFPGHRRARMVALFQTAIPISGIVGGPLSGWILDHLNSHYRAWQWLFLIEAVPAVILGLAAFRCLESGIDRVRWLNDEEKLAVAESVSQELVLKEHRPPGALFADKRVWCMGLLVLGLAVGLYAVSFWGPTLLKEAGVRSTTEIGWLTAIPNCIAVPAMLLFAQSSDLRRERRRHVGSAALIGAVGLGIAATFSQNLALVMLALSLATLGLTSAVPMQWSFVTAFLGGSGAAAAIGFINSVGNLGGLISPAMLGWLKHTTGSLAGGLAVVTVFALSSALLAFCMPAHLVNK